MKPKSTIYVVGWTNGKVKWLDQTKLPLKEEYVVSNSVERLSKAIERLEVRGAPVIGVAAGYGVALAAYVAPNDSKKVMESVRKWSERLRKTRPTAVNLFYGIYRVGKTVEKAYGKGKSAKELKEIALAEAKAIHKETIDATLLIGKYGNKLLKSGDAVLMHCNAGTLACEGIGTATAPIRTAIASGKKIVVYADQTAPLYQGARLTAWELEKDGIETYVLTDGMASWAMENKKIRAVITGADRITMSGDVFNKIGTSTVAIVAKHYGIPFYVAAPMSTIDPKTKAEDVKIELRSEEEIRKVMKKFPITTPTTRAVNPAFDRTRPEFVKAIITENGIARPPYRKSLSKLFR